MPKTGQRSTAAQQRENYKRGIIGIKAALELDADPTYINDNSHDSGPCNDVFEYKFYLTNPSLPLYSIQTPISAPLMSLGVDGGPGPASRLPSARLSVRSWQTQAHQPISKQMLICNLIGKIAR